MVEMWDQIYSSFDDEIDGLIQNGRGAEAFERMHCLLDQCWQQLYTIIKPGGFACINVGDATRNIQNHFQLFSNHSRIVSAFSKLGFDVLPSVIWRKPTNAPNKFMGSGMLPGGAYVTLEHEHILIFRKRGKRLHSPQEKMIRSNSAVFWEERNIWFSDLWTDVIGTRQKMHIDSLRKRSGAFPIEIPYRLILMYSQYGDVVLDPFSGTGTTALAAMTFGRNSINIDADQNLLNASFKIPTMHGLKSDLNQININRLRKHMENVNDKNMLFFRYKNELLKMPVKTNQEKQLTIYPIKSISKNEAEHEVIVNYRKLKKEELAEIISKSLEITMNT